MSAPASVFDQLLDDVIDASRLKTSVLVHAAVQGHTEVLTCILRRLNNKQHQTPCHDQPGLSEALTAASVGAAEQGHSTCLAAMLESGCNVHVLPKTQNERGDKTALLLAAGSKGRTALRAAAGKGHTECVQQLLQHNPLAQVAAADSDGYTALIAAANNGHVECVLQLLQHNPVAQVVAAASDGAIALVAAATNGHAECVQQLLQHNPVAQVAAADNDGYTALIAAACNGHAGCVQLLLQQNPAAQVAATDSDGDTAIVGAAWFNHPDCVALLLAHSPPDVAAAVKVAARHGHPQCLDLLLTLDLEQQHLDVAWLAALRRWNATDACTSPHTQCLERLLAKGAAMPRRPRAAARAKNHSFLKDLASRALVADRMNEAVVELAQIVRSRKRKAEQER